MNEGEFKAIQIKFRGKRVYRVATNCYHSSEYSEYPRVLWDSLDFGKKAGLLNTSKRYFKRFIERKKRIKNFDTAIVVGTGPSVDSVVDYSLDDHFTVGCNSIVKSSAIMKHCNFDIICAGDVVSHFSPCKYAAIFRRDLKSYLHNYDGIFFTTALFGYLLWVWWPDLRHKIILCEQDIDEPNVDLWAHWGLPKLDSVLNIHMFPIAGTIAKQIMIIGFDGKSPNRKENEDFWGHSNSSQYHDYVITGHLMHPTFDCLRQKKTYDRFLVSTKHSLESLHKAGNDVISLTPSHTESINKLYNPLKLKKINVL